MTNNNQKNASYIYNKNKNNYNLKPNLYINKSKKFFNFYNAIIALTKRLYLQIYRRPSTLIAGILQPLLWLILFSALYQNAPITLFAKNIKYREFLNPGIVIFTAFTGSMNAGLPIIFDREFGFFNRLIVSPLKYKTSLMLSCLLYIWTITIFQIIVITNYSIIFFKTIPSPYYIYNILFLSTLIIFNSATISISLSFILPGHIEFLAFLLVTNLPILFSSTALAPLSFMPYWLQIAACINPLTYAIEILRHTYLKIQQGNENYIIETIWINLNLNQSIIILVISNIINLLLVSYLIKYKYE
uniref:ABC transmembrane type-2 domain-containing protein n=1 Tax=Ptilothamnion sphaericum TaxID=1498216 RepID=A0A4D6X1A6_9FLOR|nr:hypothetical protein [Ptilothamnion sphaericum]